MPSLAMRLRMDLSGKSGEEKTGKQTAEAENDVPETMATSSCLPGKSKNNKIQGDEESKETRGAGGRGFLGALMLTRHVSS